MNPRLLAYALALIVVLGVATYAWTQYLEGKVRDEYGETPGILAVIHSQSNTEACERVIGVTPKAHYTLWGNIWQEDYILWEDVEIQNRRAGEPTHFVQHGRTGPVKAGDVVCGFKLQYAWVWIYLPDGSVLTSTT